MAVNIYGTQPSKNIRKDIQVIERKIYGLQYPLKNNKRGFFSKVTGLELVKNNLIQLLRTERGERVMLPNFGISLRKFLFEPLDESTFRSIQNEILTSIYSYMPNVSVVKLTVLSSDQVNYQGTSGLVVSLVVKLEEYQDNLIEVEVSVG